MKKALLPEIKPMPYKLVYICLAAIALYLSGIVIYTKLSPQPILRTTALQVIHSVFLSAVIALGGGLLLDCEMRHTENKN